MATRANIELYDGFKVDKHLTSWQKGVVLYHHWDGYPAYMGPTLTRLLTKAKEVLAKADRLYWWDSERVGALIIALSADNAEGVPCFKPCVRWHGDIEYLWRIFLGPEDGQYAIHCLAVHHDWDKTVVEELTPVDWQEAVK